VRIKNRLKYWRRQNFRPDGHAITLREFQELCGVDYRFLCDIEQGKRLPTDEELNKICQTLNIRPSDVYDDQTLKTALPDSQFLKVMP
jgi:transcriptional regulator with XRE-family HTH domain